MGLLKSLFIIASSILILTGCKPQAVKQNVELPTMLSPVYLDVSVSPFVGLPVDMDSGELDYKAIKEKGYWPEYRRAISKGFAVQTKVALEAHSNLGVISVVPRPALNSMVEEHVSFSDIRVDGVIIKENGREIVLHIFVWDMAGNKVGEKRFSHKVSPAFYRDSKNKERDSYEPVFKQVAKYVSEQVGKISKVETQRLKLISELQFGAYMDRESFDHMVRINPSTRKMELASIPKQDSEAYLVLKELRQIDQSLIQEVQPEILEYKSQLYKTVSEYRKAFQSYAVHLEKNPSTGAANLLSKFIKVKTADGKTIDFSGESEKQKQKLGSEVWNARESITADIESKGASYDYSLKAREFKIDGDVTVLSGPFSAQLEVWRKHLKQAYQLRLAE